MDTKTLCLGVLTLGDASGYDIRKHLEENFGHFMDVSSNAVYPALKALEKESQVTFRTVRQNNYPDKKVYSLTDAGRDFFTNALQVLPPRHKVRSQLLLLMFFADMLTPQRMDEIIDKRLEELHYWQTACRQWRKEQRANESDCGPRFLVDYAMAMMKAEISFLTENSDRFVQQLTQASGEAT